MEEDDIGSPKTGIIGAWLVAVASVFGLLGGMVTDLPTATIGWVCALAILIGSLLL